MRLTLFPEKKQKTRPEEPGKEGLLALTQPWMTPIEMTAIAIAAVRREDC
jgi:hypothetical protein